MRKTTLASRHDRNPIAGALSLALIAAAGFSAVAGPLIPETGKLDYVVNRDGDQIGTHVITFRRKGERLLVDTNVDVAVKLAFITLYRFAKRAREVWKDGRVVGYRVTVNDNGNIIEASAKANGTKLLLDGPNGKAVAPLGTMVSGYWSIDTVTQKALIDSEEGRLRPVEFKGGEEQTIDIKGRSFKARYYRLTGALVREVWYDAKGLLLKMRAIARDGSVIETVKR